MTSYDRQEGFEGLWKKEIAIKSGIYATGRCKEWWSTSLVHNVFRELLR